MNRILPFLICCILFSIFLTGCQPPKDLVYKGFQSVALENVSFSGATLKIDLAYYNPNNFGLALNRTDLDIFVDNNLLGHSAQDIQVAIPKRSDFVIPLKVELDVKNLLRNGLAAYTNKQVTVRALGSVKVGKAGIYKSFPVDYTTVQTFSLFK